MAPHHAVLIADPQLVDHHTYPGRPWPLSSLTMRHTDLYLRKAFITLQQLLDPDTTFFLGDLFDGGREWATRTTESVDKKWKKYGTEYWLYEYSRFGRVFVENWNTRGSRHRYIERDRKFVATLPGNHDLGFGNGVLLPVRDRFNTYFGSGNRVDVVANHSFVSIDTVTLSAKGQSTIHEQSNAQKSSPEIWEDTEEFLLNVRKEKSKALSRELRSRAGKPENPLQEHLVVELSAPIITEEDPELTQTELPTILLTHVPLYRLPGTPCGPLRERWPPSRDIKSPERDDGNAISIQKGYQYQNVLEPGLSEELVEKVGNVGLVFSGDDHDYCEVLHQSLGSGVREITVKSMSWAMGVRKPGFLMLSLWNPIDVDGRQLRKSDLSPTTGETQTVQSHLCLLPDQLSIFIRYGLLLVTTLVILLLRELLLFIDFVSHSEADNIPSPIPKSNSVLEDMQKRDRAYSQSGSWSLNSSDNLGNNHLAARSLAARTRSLSPANGYGCGFPPGPPGDTGVSSVSQEVQPTFPGQDRAYRLPERIDTLGEKGSSRRDRKSVFVALANFRKSIVQVSAIALTWYIWLVYTS